MIQEETKEIKVYTVDGKNFLNKEEAEAYQKRVDEKLNRTYFRVLCKPDLTEGKGYYGAIILSIPNTYAAEATAISYCFNNLGDSLTFVQGCSPMPNWIIEEEKQFSTMAELEEFKSEPVWAGLACYQNRKVDVKLIVLNDRGKQ